MIQLDPYFTTPEERLEAETDRLEEEEGEGEEPNPKPSLPNPKPSTKFKDAIKSAGTLPDLKAKMGSVNGQVRAQVTPQLVEVDDSPVDSVDLPEVVVAADGQVSPIDQFKISEQSTGDHVGNTKKYVDEEDDEDDDDKDDDINYTEMFNKLNQAIQ